MLFPLIKKKYLFVVKLALLFFVIFSWNSNILFADDEVNPYSLMRCNINDECRAGFVCIGGTAENSKYAESSLNYIEQQTGCCEPMLIIRQICLFHNLLSGAIGYAVTALIIITTGVSFLLGKVEFKKLITIFIGVVCIYGSYQVVALLTGYDYMVCELVDTNYAPSEGCNVLTEDIRYCADMYDIKKCSKTFSSSTGNFYCYINTAGTAITTCSHIIAQYCNSDTSATCSNSPNSSTQYYCYRKQSGANIQCYSTVNQYCSTNSGTASTNCSSVLSDDYKYYCTTIAEMNKIVSSSCVGKQNKNCENNTSMEACISGSKYQCSVLNDKIISCEENKV